MNIASYHVVFHTAAGWIGILGTLVGVRLTTLPQPSVNAVRRLLGDALDQSLTDHRPFTDLIERFRYYFSGHPVDFPCKLDLTGATPFQQAVWRAACLISYGQTRSYHWLAVQVGSPGAMRAVGQALSRNPLPVIVPCHRVLASDGGLRGFTGGLQMKKFLLALECGSR